MGFSLHMYASNCFFNHQYNPFQVMSDSESDEENENEENEVAPGSPPPPQVNT